MTTHHVPPEALPLAVGTTYVGFLAQLPPDVVLGSFTGAVIFLLGVTNKPKWQWLLLFTIAFMTGILGGSGVTSIAAGIFRVLQISDVVMPPGMGSMIAAATVINFIIWIRDNPTFFFRRGKISEKGDTE
jgi:uncharacterized membrane protein YtjA (UPF0391 family)